MNNLNDANQKALQSINAIISGQSIDLNNQQKNYLKYLISGLEINRKLFHLQSMRWGPVVEVNTTVTFAARPHPKVVHVKLDVDIPPSGSDQKPHIGCEVTWNGKRVGNDHIWIAPNLLNASRPEVTHKLEEYGYYPRWLEEEEQNHEYVKANVLHVDVRFRRWRGSSQSA